MTTSHNRVEVARIIHTIHATTQIEACRQLYQNALGGLIFAEGYFEQEDRDMALLYVANHMIEPMAPRTPDDHTKPFARLTARIGQAFHSFELKVADGKGGTRPAQASDVTHVRWSIASFAPGASGTLEYHAVVR